MPRPLRLDFPGALHHVTARGNRRQVVCEDDVDYRWFCRLLSRVARVFEWECSAWCVMPNHVHLLIATPKAGISAGMQLLTGRYAQCFNHRRGLDGHLFQGRFHSALVESEMHLLELSRYIALNPVRAGLCLDPAEWHWSSYSAIVAGRPPDFLRADRILGLFGHGTAAVERYERFVLEGAAWPRSAMSGV